MSLSNNYFIEFCSNWNLKSYQSKNAIAKGIKKFINIIIALHATILKPSSLKLFFFFFFKSILFIASHKILIKNANFYLLIHCLFWYRSRSLMSFLMKLINWKLQSKDTKYALLNLKRNLPIDLDKKLKLTAMMENI